MDAKNLSIIVVVAALIAVAIGARAKAAPGPTDLVLIKADSAHSVAYGSSLTYTISVRNTGANDASGVVVTDTLPSEVDYVSATSSLGTCSRIGDAVTCDLGRVNAGVTATATILVTAEEDGAATTTATVVSPEDTDGTNNADTETTLISR